jgi:hypothetical protein
MYSRGSRRGWRGLGRGAGRLRALDARVRRFGAGFDQGKFMLGSVDGHGPLPAVTSTGVVGPLRRRKEALNIRLFAASRLYSCVDACERRKYGTGSGC